LNKEVRAYSVGVMLPDTDILIRLLLAAVLGSLIGFERERLLWAAGIRTHMLVCVGACLFMIVSAYGFAPVLGPNIVLDPSRVAAQVVSGIGFLGAGAILARGEIVKGLTTAASIWTVGIMGAAELDDGDHPARRVKHRGPPHRRRERVAVVDLGELLAPHPVTAARH